MQPLQATIHTETGIYTGSCILSNNSIPVFSGQGHFMAYDGSYSYNGEWVDNKIHGIGTHVLKNGDYCKGTWNEGKFSEGLVKRTYDGYSYEGQWHGNAPNGQGKCVWQNPENGVYVGKWKDGKHSGAGIWEGVKNMNGDLIYRMHGIFHNNELMTGNIVSEGQNGVKYEGGVIRRHAQLIYHGIGTVRWPDSGWEKGYQRLGIKGGTFTGQFPCGWRYEVEYNENRIADYFKVKGESGITLGENFILPDGSEWVFKNDSAMIGFEYYGEMENNLFDGWGKCVHLEEKWLFTGEWERGSFTAGCLQHKNGWTYDGPFFNGKFHGKGSFKKENITYTGVFQNGLFHGLFVLLEREENTISSKIVNYRHGVPVHMPNVF